VRNDELAMIDVRPSWGDNRLWLWCTSCNWADAQDPGGPTLSTLVRHAEEHLREVHHQTAPDTDPNA
jgi:hypothetical protein